MWRRKVLILSLLGFALVIVGAVLLSRPDWGKQSPPDDEHLWFADVTDEVGLDFVHDVGDVSLWDLPQIQGSGVAVFDFDGDGRLDLYFLNYGEPGSGRTNRLFKNMPDGTFQDVSKGSGLDIIGRNTGVIIGDVNNDGLPDVLVTQVDGVKLLLNRGKGTFADITEPSGLKNPLWGTSANFFDFDRDGWLDLVVVNYLENDPTQQCKHPNGRRTYCGPAVMPGTVSKLFRNLGRDGKGVRFEDVTVKSGLSKAPGAGLGVYCADFNGDGWPDIFIANDAKPNHLWINRQNGTFEEEAYLRGIALDGMGKSQAGMGVAVGDSRGIGLLDVYITHLASERNTLWQQGPKPGQFTDQTARAGLLNTRWHGTGWGTLMRDFDQDGWLDLAVVNGAITQGTPTPNPALGEHFSQFSERNQVMRNVGQGKFQDISDANGPFCGTANVGRGLATGDLNGDGALDLVVTTAGGRARIFRNVARSRGHWLIVRALDPRLKRDAYGAEVVVQVGDRRLFRVINPGDGYQCSSDPRAHYGLGEATRFDSIRVKWPDGLTEVFLGGDADRPIVLERGKGKAERSTKDKP